MAGLFENHWLFEIPGCLKIESAMRVGRRQSECG
jgi:hypothetical protein